MPRRHRSPIFTHAAEQWATMRHDYAIALEVHIAYAEAVTVGVLLNARGRAAGIHPDELFRRGGAFAAAYASDELTEFWRTTPRPTLAAFEREWVTYHHAQAERTEQS